MAEDITPKLLKAIKTDFMARVGANQRIKTLTIKARDGTISYAEANRYAIEVGNCLAKSFKNKLSSAVLPDGKMYYNIANEIINDTLHTNYDMISEVAAQAQTSFNSRSKIRIKGKRAEINQDRIDNMIERLTESELYDDIAWILDDPVINFSQNIVTDTVKTNAEFLQDAGMRSQITRTVIGKSCDWCEEKAGTYFYGDEPDDFYAQHENCRCMITYEGVTFNKSRGSSATYY